MAAFKKKWAKWAFSGIGAAIVGVLIAYFVSEPTSGEGLRIIQKIGIAGCQNTIHQSINPEQVESIDLSILAEKIAAHLKNTSPLQTSRTDEAIRELLKTLSRLENSRDSDKNSDSGIKRKAIKLLADKKIKEALDLLESAARKTTSKIQKAKKNVAQEWIDIGNIAFFIDSRRALKAYQTSIDLDPQNGEAWNRLSHVERRIGNYKKAIVSLQKALEFSKGDSFNEAAIYNNIGEVLRLKSDLNRALDMFKKALEINKKDNRIRALVLGNMGNIYVTWGDLDKALELFQQSMKINKELGNKNGIAFQYANIGNIYVEQEKFDDAIEFYNKSIDLSKELGLKDLTSGVMANMGVIYGKKGDIEASLKIIEESIKIDKELENIRGVADGYINLGNIFIAQNDLDHALKMYQKALDINNELSNKEGVATIYCNIGLIYQKKGGRQKSQEFFQKSIDIFSEIGSDNMVKKVKRLQERGINS